MEIQLNGVAGSICLRCATVLLIFVVKATDIAGQIDCPTVDDFGYFCGQPMSELASYEIDNAIRSYYDLNLAGDEEE